MEMRKVSSVPTTCSLFRSNYVRSSDYVHLPNPQQIPNYQDQEQYLKAYYEQYYKEWYRQHNEANTETESSLSESSSPMPRRQIKFQFGKSGDFAENTPQTSETYPHPSQPSSFGALGSVQQPTYVAPQTEAAPETTTSSPPLTRVQLDKICADIQKTTQSFGIKDPKTFALNNCSLIKMYYKQVTCEQINNVMDYCERGAFLAS
ncbi:unnamed protein product [Cylicocyclus nassatus]|uniref:aECM cysteine-cradle domain-containing protein n=1 Tax=Cylicocyclus nassatus TaxID=53992 RepID=A0AA36DRW9_CYLNA|nr:unnamed protein product [Cylicocyclus nassatus]